MHAQISINTLCLINGPFDMHVAQVAAFGVAAISPGVEEVAAFGAAGARRLLDHAGLAVATLTHRAFAFSTLELASAGRIRLDATIAIAEVIGAKTITFTTGGRGALDWGEAAERFAAEIAPSAARARAAGVVLSLEPTSHLYADVSIAHRLMDTVVLARAGGIGVGIDLFACWTDSDITQAIAASGPHTALVQVSDYVAGDRGLPCRAVPGDGMIPLGRLIKLILQGGYSGFFDVEIIGPRIVQNREAKLRHAADTIGRMLEAG